MVGQKEKSERVSRQARPPGTRAEEASPAPLSHSQGIRVEARESAADDEPSEDGHKNERNAAPGWQLAARERARPALLWRARPLPSSYPLVEPHNKAN